MDAGSLLKGLADTNKPHEALDVPIGAQTTDIKKAFRKMALKYHPDKNPKATPLFQAISTASEKLSDTTTRKKEEAKAANTSGVQKTTPTPTSAKPPQSKPTTSSQQRGSSNNSNSSSSSYGYAHGFYGYNSGAQGAAQKPQYSQYANSKPYPGAYKAKQAEQEFRRRQEERQQQKTEKQHYNAAGYNHAGGTGPKSYASRDEETEADVKAFRERKERSEKAEQEARKRNEAYKREADARKEAEEKARKHREEVLREGQRAYNEEVKRRREAELKRKEAQDAEVRKQAGAAAAARAESTRKPTANFPNRKNESSRPTPLRMKI